MRSVKICCLFTLLRSSFEAFLIVWKMTMVPCHPMFVLHKDCRVCLWENTPRLHNFWHWRPKVPFENASSRYLVQCTCCHLTLAAYYHSYHSAILLCLQSVWTRTLPAHLTSELLLLLQIPSLASLSLFQFVPLLLTALEISYLKACFSSVFTTHPDLIYHQQNVSHLQQPLVLVMLTCLHLLLLLVQSYANYFYLTVLPQPPSLLLPLPSDADDCS